MNRGLKILARTVALPALIAAALSLAGSPLSAQAWAGKGRLQGTVTDEQSKPIDKVKITFQKAELGGPPPIYSDARGKFAILGLGNGQWKVLLEKEGYQISEGSLAVNEFATNPALSIQLKAAQAAPAEAKGSAAVDAIQKGNQLLTAEKFAEARAEYEKALAELEPANQPAVLRGVARTYFQEKKVDPAIETLKRALEIAPDDPETLKLIVNLLVAADREEEAKAYIAKLPEGTGVDVNSLLNLGIKAFNDNKLDAAVGYFDRVVKENPGLAEGYYYRGLSYLGQGKSAEAKADFQKLLEIAPDHERAAEAKEFIKSL